MISSSVKDTMHTPSSAVEMAICEVILPDALLKKSQSVSQTKPDKPLCVVGHSNVDCNETCVIQSSKTTKIKIFTLSLKCASTLVVSQ